MHFEDAVTVRRGDQLLSQAAYRLSRFFESDDALNLYQFVEAVWTSRRASLLSHC